MSSYYSTWMGILDARDIHIEMMVMMAIAIIAGWEMINLYPEDWQAKARVLYILGGIGLYLSTIWIAIRGAHESRTDCNHPRL